MGSTSLTTDANGNVISEMRYTAWGEVRYNSGVTPTDYTYTGQYSYTQDFGLMFYNARWYDPSLGRFAQADSIIPPGVQGLDRYACVNNSPLNYVDPSGHINGRPCELLGKCEEIVYDDDSDRLPITAPKVKTNKSKDNDDSISLEKFGESGSGSYGYPSIPELEEEENELSAAQQMIKFLGYLSDYEDIINSSKPIYKQVKYGFNTGPIEAITDGLLYGLDDRWSTSLTPSQRVWRVGVVAGQSLVVDRVSDKAGALGNALGKPGEIATQYLVSAYLSDFVVPTTTYYVFNTFNLGLPQNHKPVRLNPH